jgi:uncharacterized protein (DUF427 family)
MPTPLPAHPAITRPWPFAAEAVTPAPAVLPSPRWVRVRFGGQIIADSRRALLLRQYGDHHQMPTYYFPQADVRMETLVAEADQDGLAWHAVRVGDRLARAAAWVVTAPGRHPALAGYVSFSWARMDAWYEEDEEILVHARDPYHRIDVLPSTRHVRVVVAGETVAESRRPHILFETNLPPRYYLAPEEVRLLQLTPTSLRTRCPYKGEACYFSVHSGGRLHADLVWSYPDPIAECPKIRGRLCFFNEHIDLYIDGELQPRPLTPWSRGE